MTQIATVAGEPEAHGAGDPSTARVLAELLARHQQLTAIVALGQAALAGVAPTDLFDRAVRLLVSVLPVEYAKVLHVRPDGTLLLTAGVGWHEGLVGSAVVETHGNSQAGYTLLSDAPVIVDNLEFETRFTPNLLLREHHVRSGMSVIIPGGAQPYGILSAHSSQPRHFTGDDINCLQAAAYVLAEALRREATEHDLRSGRDSEWILRRQVEEYSERLRTAHESERRKIARELHDEVGQELTALKFMLERIEAGGTDSALAITTAGIALVGDLLDRVHDLSLDLRPPVLDDFGLVPALMWLGTRFEERAGITVQFHHGGLNDRLPSEIEIGAYRLVQESLTNVARHADTDRCTVRCLVAEGLLEITVRDDGSGFVMGSRTGGLAGMEERVRALGGTLYVQSAPAAGTAIHASIPVPVRAE